MTIRQSDCESPDEHLALDLAAQIHARYEKSQRALADALENSAHSPLIEIFCHEADVHRAMEQFYAQPFSKTLSKAVASLVLQAAQRFAANLMAAESIKSCWRGMHWNVAIFEAAAYFWSTLSLAVRESVRHEFDHDREAVAGAMLGSFSALMAMMKNRWPEFIPEKYALSRLFFYPSDATVSAAHFCRLLMASESCLLPLPPGEVPNGTPIEPLDATEQAVLATIENACNEVIPGVNEAVLKMVSEYLENRLD